MKIKTEIKWAIIFAVMTLAWLALEKVLGYHDEKIANHAIFSNIIILPAVTIYVLGLLEKRRVAYQGYMTYKQGLISGLIITGIVTLLVPVTQSIISLVITPDYFQNAQTYAIEQGKLTAEEAAAYFNLKSYILQGVIATPIIGTFTTLIIALFTRKQA